MKKILLLIIVFSANLSNSFSQIKEWKVGITAFPLLAWSRATPEQFTNESNVRYEFSGVGTKLRGGFGFFGDYFYNDNIAFNIGLNYYFAGSGFKVTNNTQSENTVKNIATQHIQVPLGLKLISNYITDNFKIFFNPGITTDFRVVTYINGKKEYQPTSGAALVNNNKFTHFFGLNFRIAAGVEYTLPNDMTAIIGFSYSRGLLNTTKDEEYRARTKNAFMIKNDYVSLDLALRF
jgi:opacity protein-like surface antigen